MSTMIEELSRPRESAVQREQLVAAARDLAPLLREHAGEAERAGRLPAAVADALHDAGFFGLHVPEAVGGAAEPLGTAVAVYEELARSSAAAAWCAVLLSSGGLIASRMPTQAREMLWADDPRAGVCGSFAPGGTGRAVTGGLRVSGTWRPLSGVHHSRWVLAPVLVPDPDGGPARVVATLLPTEALRVEHTWQVAGMAGTGSDTAVADNLFVPAILTAPMSELLGRGAVRSGEPLTQAAVYSSSAVGVGAVVVGMGRGALDLLLTSLQTGKAAAGTSFTDARDVPSVRRDVAIAAQLLDTAGLHLARATEDVERSAAASQPLQPTAAARIRADLATISTSTRQAVGHLLDAGGSRSFATTDPLQRIWRDVEVVSRHPMLAEGVNLDVYARTLLGLATDIVPLL